VGGLSCWARPGSILPLGCRAAGMNQEKADGSLHTFNALLSFPPSLLLYPSSLIPHPFFILLSPYFVQINSLLPTIYNLRS
jgi:hypothetical protein